MFIRMLFVTGCFFLGSCGPTTPVDTTDFTEAQMLDLDVCYGQYDRARDSGVPKEVREEEFSLCVSAISTEEPAIIDESQ